MKNVMRNAGHWIGLLLVADGVYLFAVWVVRKEAFKYMALFLCLFTLLAVLTGIWAEYRRQKKAREALERFLELPDERAARELTARLGGWEVMESLCTRLLEQAAENNERTVELSQYREYMEGWVHEAKTPLSLSTLVLENHQEEMSPYVYGRLCYIQRQLSGAVERILYYARLGADHVDYKFTEFELDGCVREAILDYQPFLAERGIVLEERLSPLRVTSDRKVVLFMLSQLLNNAVKYADDAEGRILVSMEQKEERICLGIYNNGQGVPPEDAPFLFDKGFTGNHPSRQKATGMGLYLVAGYARKLCVEVAFPAAVPFPGGFGIELVFAL